jgi:hypothetical protein
MAVAKGIMSISQKIMEVRMGVNNNNYRLGYILRD